MEIGTELVLAQQNIQAPAQFEPLNPPAIRDKPLSNTAIVRCGSVSIEVDENISDAFLLRLRGQFQMFKDSLGITSHHL